MYNIGDIIEPHDYRYDRIQVIILGEPDRRGECKVLHISGPFEGQIIPDYNLSNTSKVGHKVIMGVPHVRKHFF